MGPPSPPAATAPEGKPPEPRAVEPACVPAAGAPEPEGARAPTDREEPPPAGVETVWPEEGYPPQPEAGQAEQLPGDAEAPPQWGYAVPPGYGMPQGYGFPQPYGAPAGMAPWYSPLQMYSYPSPYPGFFWWPFPAPYYPPPPFMMMPYGAVFPGQMPYQYPAQQYPYAPGPAPYSGAPRHGRMRPLYIVLIILGALIVIGGGVVAAILLSGGSSNASFRLGDGSVVGSNIQFSNMVIRQNGSTVTLTGTYDNSGTYAGDVIVTVRAMTSTGQQQLMSFTVPVVLGSGKTFSQQQAAGSLKLSGATLSSIEASGSSSGTGTYPFNSSGGTSSSPSSSGSSTLPQFQSTLPFDSSTQNEYETVP